MFNFELRICLPSINLFQSLDDLSRILTRHIIPRGQYSTRLRNTQDSKMGKQSVNNVFHSESVQWNMPISNMHKDDKLSLRPVALHEAIVAKIHLYYRWVWIFGSLKIRNLGAAIDDKDFVPINIGEEFRTVSIGKATTTCTIGVFNSINSREDILSGQLFNKCLLFRGKVFSNNRENFQDNWLLSL